MPATPTERLEHLGIGADELAAGGALCTAREIEQQPHMLQRTHALLGRLQAELRSFIAPVADDPRARIILTGAGTSAYIGSCLADVLDAQLACRVDAVPTTDIVSHPNLHLHADQKLLLVSFGRSGNSPESLQAVTLAESLVADVRHLFVTCNSEGALNRTQWKYQDWLAGFNGGPLRAPTLRIPDRFMKSLRQGLVASGCEVTSDPDSAFMTGRHPC